MTPQAAGAGVRLDFREQGSGPAVLLVHGMGDGAAGWQPVVEALSTRGRVVAYDRRGYGESEAPEPYERTLVEEQAEDAASLLEEIGGAPAVACGRDFGALVCLDLAKRHAHLLSGVVLVDPPVYALVPEATEALAAERVALEEDLRDRGAAEAVAAHLERAGRAPEVVERARLAPRAFFADYAGMAQWPVSKRELRAISLPAVVGTGRNAPPHTEAAARALADLLPAARHDDALEPAGAVESLLRNPA